jgi:Tol biopolymer transport system component
MLLVIDLNNNEVSQIAELGEYARQLSWSTNLTSIACVFHENGQSRVFVVEYPEGIVTRITETENNTTEYAPTWSPDGNSLAYIAVRPTGESLVIWNVSSHDTIANDVWIGGYQVLLPAWAPNGKHLSFYRSLDLDQDGFRTTKIWIVGSDGEEARPLLMSSPHSE